jgi:hypothetical protein
VYVLEVEAEISVSIISYRIVPCFIETFLRGRRLEKI